LGKEYGKRGKRLVVVQVCRWGGVDEAEGISERTERQGGMDLS